jgi:hypothetical protein
MNKMHARMQDVLLPLFAQYGVPSPFAVWESTATRSQLTWMLEWPSLEARNATWANFRPVWEAEKRVRNEPEFVTRTDLTLLEPWRGHEFHFFAEPDACESAWLVQPKIGQGAEFRKICCEQQFGRFAEIGSMQISAADFVFGPLPQCWVVFSWKNEMTRRRGARRIRDFLSELSHPMTSLLVTPGDWSSLNRAQYLLTWGKLADRSPPGIQPGLRH